jgi:hypothetical protein
MGWTEPLGSGEGTTSSSPLIGRDPAEEEASGLAPMSFVAGPRVVSSLRAEKAAGDVRGVSGVAELTLFAQEVGTGSVMPGLDTISVAQYERSRQ